MYLINNLYDWRSCGLEEDPNSCWLYVNTNTSYSSLIDYKGTFKFLWQKIKN